MSCFHTRKFIVSNAVVALAISLLRHQHGRKLWWEQVRKSWKTGVKQKQRQRSKMQPLPMHSLVPRLGGGWERASGTQCLRMRLIATEFRGNCVHTCMYTGDFINLLCWLAVGVLFEWVLYRDSLLQDTIKWSVWGCGSMTDMERPHCWCQSVLRLSKIRQLRDDLPADTKTKLYNTFVLPHLDYCYVLWHECSKEVQHRVETYPFKATEDSKWRTEAEAEVDTCWQTKGHVLGGTGPQMSMNKRAPEYFRKEFKSSRKLGLRRTQG